MICSRCGAVRCRANLTSVGDELVCPPCLYKKAEHEWTHQKVAA
jgi:formylmethanofuran dehydrogenase subunit E